MGFMNWLFGKGESQSAKSTCSKCGTSFAEFADQGPDVLVVMTVEQAQRKAYYCSKCKKEYCGKCCNVKAGVPFQTCPVCKGQLYE
jgi:uncharacterized protein with PIN domain